MKPIFVKHMNIGTPCHSIINLSLHLYPFIAIGSGPAIVGEEGFHFDTQRVPSYCPLAFGGDSTGLRQEISAIETSSSCGFEDMCLKV